jgi:hypothetical protein
LGKILSSASSSISTKSFRRPPPLRGDPWQDPAWDFASLSPPSSIPRRLPPDACCASSRRSQCVCTPVEAPSAVLPVVPRWRLPSAVPGRPRGHYPAMPAKYAPGRLVSFSFPFLPSASLTGHGLWPYWSRSVSQAHRSHSVMLLLDASLWIGLIQLVVSCLISDISTVLLSLSMNFSDRDVILNLALLQSSVNICNLLW